MLDLNEEFSNLISDKTVAIVGPAKSISGLNNGNMIDKYDTVVRLNYAKIEKPSDSGKRTDIIYYDGSFHDHKNQELKFLVCSYPETEWFFESRCRNNINYYKNLYKHRIVSSHLYKNLKKSLDPKNKIRPNTGLIAILDVLLYNPKKVFITGIDFYRTSYLKTHPDYGQKSLEFIKKQFSEGDSGDYHDPDKQYQLFKKLYLKNRDKLLLDEFMSNIIEDSFYDSWNNKK